MERYPRILRSNSYQKQYADITKKIMEKPTKIGNSRIGKINSRFCEQIRIDLKAEFPLMDIKWIKFSNIIHELLWMVRGESNIKYLVENDCHIWTDDAYRYYKEKYSPLLKYKRINGFTKQIPIDYEEDITKEQFVEKVLNEETLFVDKYSDTYRYGNLDRIYGVQWRNFNDGTDQIQNVIDTLKKNPDDRRMIVTGHNPADLEEGNVGLPSCHNYMQFYTTINEDGSRDLSCFCNIRSNDWFLGQPYNTPQYALLTHMIAKVVGMGVGELVVNAVDAHLYHEHFDAAKIWLSRYKRTPLKTLLYNEMENGGHRDIGQYWDSFCKAKLTINGDQEHIDNFKAEDFVLENYNPQKYIKAKLLT